MNLHLLQRLKFALAALTNRYEAAIPWTTDRPWIPAFVRDARFDANSYTRWELCRKARYERANNWLIQRLESVDVKYTVGPHGMVVIPQSSNPEWNKRMAEEYALWCEMPFLDSGLPMFQGQHVTRKEMHVDGEVFSNCTYLKTSGSQSIPAIELIESHRVSSPGKEYEYPNDVDDVQDGVQLSKDEFGRVYGRPKGFHTRQGVEGEKWSLIPAFDPRKPGAGGMIHTYDPDRIGMARGITKYAALLNEIADLGLMWMLEMDKSKSNAQMIALWETWNGEIPGTLTDGGNFSRSSLPGVPGGMTDEAIAKRLQAFQKKIQGQILAMKPGEKMTIPENNNPSASQQWLWKFVIERVAIARDIPMMLVLPDSMQGTMTRVVTDDAQIGFTTQFAINSRAAKQIYRFFTSWAKSNIKGLQDAPGDWMQCHVIPPPFINVDFGRNMAAIIAGIDAGIYDFDTIASRDSSTAADRFLKKARNVAMVRKICKQVEQETGEEVKPEEVMGNLAEIVALMNKGNTEAHGDEGDTNKTGKKAAKANDPEMVEND